MRWDAAVDMGWGFGTSLVTITVVGLLAFTPLLAAIAGIALTEIFYGAENLGVKKMYKDLIQ